MAKKVYQAVPIAEPWATGQIVGEMRRIGSSAEYRVVAGCLDTLKQTGLVIETNRGTFQRTTVREKIVTPKTEQAATAAPTIETKEVPVPSTITATKTSKKTPIDKLTDIAARVAQLGQTFKSLADEVTNVAIEIEESSRASTEELEQLRQLKTILNGLRDRA